MLACPRAPVQAGVLGLSLCAIGEDETWKKLRALLQVEIQAMEWRLSTLDQAEGHVFLDELTDRVYAKFHVGR